MKFVKFAYELKNMLLHIFRLEAKASLSGRRKKDRSGKSRAQRRVEDIIGKGSAVAERMPLKPQTVLLRADVSPALESKSALVSCPINNFT